MTTLLVIFLHFSFTPGFTAALSNIVLTLQTERTCYLPGEVVQVLGTVKDPDGSPIQEATIAIEVKNPSNSTIFLDIVYSLSDGSYSDSFGLSSNSSFGQYKVYTTASKTGYSNAASDSTFAATVQGDINGDFVVNFNDLSTLAKAYGATLGVPHWNRNADINNDDKIDIRDLFMLSRNYGKTP